MFLQAMFAYSSLSEEVCLLIRDLAIDLLYVRFAGDFVYEIQVWMTDASIHIFKDTTVVHSETENGDKDDLLPFWLAHCPSFPTFHQITSNTLCVLSHVYDSNFAFGLIHMKNQHTTYDFMDTPNSELQTLTGVGAHHILAFCRMKEYIYTEEQLLRGERWQVWFGLEIGNSFDWVAKPEFPPFTYKGPVLKSVLLCAKKVVVFETRHPRQVAVLWLELGEINPINVCNKQNCFAAMSCVGCLLPNNEDVLVLVSKGRSHSLCFHVVNIRTQQVEQMECQAWWFKRMHDAKVLWLGQTSTYLS